MKQTHECAPTAAPLLPVEETPGTTVATLLEGLADIIIEAGPAVRRLETAAAKRLEQHLQSCQRTEALIGRHQDQLFQISQRLVASEQALGTIARETARAADNVSRQNQRFEAFAFNLEQVRTLADSIVLKQQELVEDFIERRVTDHLFKEFLNIQFALMRYSANSNGSLKEDVQATAEAIGSFLAESGLRVISPTAGAVFDPREHQPIKIIPVTCSQADGTIVETFIPGLSRTNRVIQQARVAVFKAEGVKTTTQ